MGRLVPAVTRALDVLELFLDSDGTLSAPEVTRRLELPRTTVHELLTTLAARSYLVQLPDQPGRYRLGVRTYQLGSRYAEQLDLAAEGQQVARGVAETCDETVHVAVLEDADVIYIAKVDSTHAVRMVSAAGRRLPAHCTSVGKMLLASLPPTELEARLRRAGVHGHDRRQHHRPRRAADRARRDPRAGRRRRAPGVQPGRELRGRAGARQRRAGGGGALHLRADDPLERGARGGAGRAGREGAGDLSVRLGHRGA